MTEIALYTSAEGNYFFREIRDIFAAALAELGCRTSLRDGSDAWSRSASAHIVIAPHEFFHLGAGRAMRARVFPPRTALYATEQRGSDWFPLGQSHFKKAAVVWEIDRETSRFIQDRGFACRHVPLGYAKGSGLFDPVRALPRRRVLAGWGDLRGGKRPIDAFFAGNGTERRVRFFGRAAPRLGRFRCFVHFTSIEEPALGEGPDALDSRLSIGLVQRSKIVLNLHRTGKRYFEWQRIVLQGIGQKALVISEPVGDGSPFLAGRDFVEAPLDDIPRAVAHYLSPSGRREARRVAETGYRTLVSELPMRKALAPALDELLSHDPRRGIPGGRHPREIAALDMLYASRNVRPYGASCA